jgi:hypothetical protein
MRRAAVLLSVVGFSALGFSVACGGGYGGEQVKTPDEIVAEQEALAVEDEKRRDATDTGVVGDEELESDQKQKFDVRQAKIELKRATRSAVTCPGSIGTDEKLPAPKATVTLTFANHGNVSKANIDAAFNDSAIGKCVLRAMKAVIVPPFAGQEVVVDWEVDFSKAEEEEKE